MALNTQEIIKLHKKTIFHRLLSTPQLYLTNINIKVKNQPCGEMAERLKALVLKTRDSQGSGGSNPSLSVSYF